MEAADDAFDPSRRESSTPHYQTFPTNPPSSKGPPHSRLRSQDSSTRNANHENGQPHDETPLPKKQLAILGVIALAEQTALNSIGPYLPAMALGFPGVSQATVGLYVGLIASAFALAQCASGYFWGLLSDRIGRKPVILLGTVMTAACFAGFGFCKTLGAAIAVQTLMGLVNGNQGVVSTVLGELTDRSNQGRAFTYLPVVYGLGGITGPTVGGMLVNLVDDDDGFWGTYPYLPPNIFSATILLVDFGLACWLLEESHEAARDQPPLPKRIGNLFAWIWQFAGGSHRPSYVRTLSQRERHGARLNHYRNGGSDDLQDPDEYSGLLPGTSMDKITYRDIFNRDTVLLLLTYLVFSLSNVAYNTLYPIFGEGKAPTGRDLSTQEVGLSLSFSGLVTILFQVGIYGRLRDKLGNRASYRVSIAGFVAAFLLMPWVGYKTSSDGRYAGMSEGKLLLWVELGAILVIKTVAAVGGLTSALLLITNSAPSHAVLGQINGLAQTLASGGRAVGPFVSGALFSAATRLHPKGEAMPFGVFAGIAFLGFLLSWGIRSPDLEGDGWEEDHDESPSDHESGWDEDDHDH
ncbi:MFS general substrate transporter [Eremomyces bilateralis CBS 781.70]|uniref:MFS general substrate transporter n=1 Tax=Eremomyces bilateralis CBS 781.70 TaxID=1392243 RepID=A0A6G1G3Y3_9PEZI|nr:MFS general substrate transporter [Eremomyces bilateralis CBS 781.70]KAF1812692.1 MFS general substrate transporter [Eremomyces bilateralis CBS 781.70]